MKTCYKCKVEKDDSQYTKSKKNSDGLFSWCKQCRSELDKVYHKKRDLQKKYSQVKERIIENKKFVDNYLSGRCCEHCGNNNRIVLEFHHFNKDKEYNVSNMMTLSKKKIEKEMKKCQILCANCHRIVTYNERSRM